MPIFYKFAFVLIGKTGEEKYSAGFPVKRAEDAPPELPSGTFRSIF